MQSNDPLADLEVMTWTLAAIVSTMREALITPLADVLAAAPQRTKLLEAAGIVRHHHGEFVPVVDLPQGASAVHAKLSSLRQAVAAAAGESSAGWAALDDDVLINQGRASAATGKALARVVVPTLSGLADRLNTPGSRILDVGTGIGAIAVELARAFTHTEIIGIDILERALQLAKREMPADVVDRVSLLQLDIAGMAEHSAYDLIWLPAPFLADDILHESLRRAAQALRPTGWVVVGTNPGSLEPVQLAAGQWMAVLNGGNSYQTNDIVDILGSSGLVDIQRFPTVPRGPVLVAGQRR